MTGRERFQWFIAAFCWLPALGISLLAADTGDDLNFGRLTPKDGLPAEQVNRIYEDSRGFLWFGTLDGLARYDSREFQIFRPSSTDPKSLGNGSVNDILEDPQGNLWIATLGGLDLWHRDTEQFSHYRHDPNNATSLGSDRLKSLLLDKDGSLWVGTYGAGLNHFDPRTGKCERFESPPGHSNNLSQVTVRCLFRDRLGLIWIGTGSSGLYRLDAKTNRLHAYACDPANPRSLSDPCVHAIAEDADGYLWVGTANGISRLDPERRFFERFPVNINDPDAMQFRITDAIRVDRSGRVWVGTDGGGLSLFEPATRKFIHYRCSKYAGHTLGGDVVRTIFEDRSGDLWIGHYPDGVSHANRLNAPFRVFRSLPGETNTLSDDQVLSFLEEPSGDLWVGTDGGGLNRWSQATGHWTHYRHDPHDPSSLSANSVLALTRDYRGRLWVGTWDGGLDCFDPNTGAFRHYQPDPTRTNSLSNSRVWRLLEDRQRQLWVATMGGGLDRYVPEKDGFVAYRYDPAGPQSRDTETFWSLLETRNGALWAGTSQGLARWAAASGSWDRFQNQPGQPGLSDNKAIMDLIEDREGILWMTTKGGGLKRLDPRADRLESFLTAKNLPSDILRGILEDDDGMLWVSSNQGLARIDPRTRNIRVFDESNGLPGHNYFPNARLRLRSGELLFGSTRGFVRFNPRAVQLNTHLPPVVITSFEMSQKLMLPGRPDSPLEKCIVETRQLRIPASAQVLSFQFAALSYRSSERNQYRYQLEGFDQGWRAAGAERRAHYTNLDPGEYWFRVQAANNDGLWNETGTSLKLIILPPWWRTWWFRGTAALGFLALAVAAGWAISARQSRGRLRAAERELRMAQERERAALALREKSEELDLYFTTALDLFCIADTDGFFQRLNPQWQSVLGYSQAELEGRRFLDFVHPEDIAATERAVTRLTAQEQVPNFVNRYRRQDGSYRWIEWCASPRGNRIYAAARDITERRGAEEQVRLDESRLEGLLKLNQMSNLSTQDIAVYAMEEAIRLTQSSLGYIAFVNQDETVMTMHAWSKAAMRECRVRDLPLVYPVAKTGLWGEAIRQRRPVVTNDYPAPNPLKKGVPEGHVHLERHMNIPIFDGDRIVVVAGVGNKPADYDTSDVRQLTLLIEGMWRIVQRKRAEELLKSSEQNYREIFNATEDAIFVHDEETGTILDVNHAVEEMLQYPREEVMRLGLSGFIPGAPPYSEQDAKDRLHKAVAEGPQLFEWMVRRKNGELFWVEVHLKTSVIAGQGRVVSVVRDITDRKQGEAAIQKSLSLLQATLESTADGILVVDSAARKVTRYNRRFGELLKVPEELLTSGDDESVLKLVTEQMKDPEAFLVRVRELLAQPLAEGYDLLELADGRVLERYSRPQLLNGCPTGRVWSFRDLTERKQAEREKANLQAQLIQTQKLEAIGTLAGGIAHDFNNILGGIIGYTELARQQSLDQPELQQDLAYVLQGCNRAKDLVRQILSFSRQTKQERQPLALHLVAKEALKLLRATLPATIEMVAELPKELPLVLADATQIHQILMNLCTNSAHAMRGQTGRLEVTLASFPADTKCVAAFPEMRPGLYVRLQIRDTGHGMDEATRKRIFEPFFTTKGPGEGTGLGLSVVHGIVKDHDGAIHVDSQPGLGTTVQVYFPALSRNEESLSASPSILIRGQQERVLVIDDESILCSIMSRMLHQLGYQPMTCTQASQALAEFYQHPDQFDLVISDLNMPGMTGVNLAAAMLAIRPHLPVLLTSGISGTHTPETIRDLGLKGFLLKPVNMAELSEAVHRALTSADPATHEPAA